MFKFAFPAVSRGKGKCRQRKNYQINSPLMISGLFLY